MSEPPDFRSEKMDSPEGRGIALGRWSAFWYSIPDDVLADTYGDNPKRSIADYDEEVRDDIAEAVLDDSELIGFWVAWHKAGGFAHLESGGWHRATIFRKVRKFRTRYGAHPDEYTFPWIKLDLKRTWSDELSGRIVTLTRSPDQRFSNRPPSQSAPMEARTSMDGSAAIRSRVLP